MGVTEVSEAQEVQWCTEAYDEGFENSLLEDKKENPYSKMSILHDYWERGNSQDLQ